MYKQTRKQQDIYKIMYVSGPMTATPTVTMNIKKNWKG